MTTPLDRDLAERLERLAAAVPVRPGQLDPVHASAVQARQQLRLRWLTPLVALLLLGLLAGLIGIGTLNAFNGPISTTTRVGDFVLTFHSARAQYATGEPIDLSASLTYDGPNAAVQISHAHLTPLGFGVTEPVNGFQLSPGWRMSCETEQLTQGVPLARGFRKSGGNSDDPVGFARFMSDPNLHLPAGRWHAYAVAYFGVGDCGSGDAYRIRADLTIEVVDRPTPTARPTPTEAIEVPAIHVVNADPASVEIVFRDEVVGALACGESTVITPGELGAEPPWTLSVREIDGATLDAVTLDGKLPAGILIRDGSVLSGPWPMSYGPAFSACDPSTLPQPTEGAPGSLPTPGPVMLGGPVIAHEVGDDTFELHISTQKGFFSPDEAIEVHVHVGYLGPEQTIDMWSADPAVTYEVEQLDGVHVVRGGAADECAKTEMYYRSVQDYAFTKGAAYDANDPDADWIEAYLSDPDLHLPVGTWRLTAYFEGSVGECGVGLHKLQSSIVIVVLDPAAQIDLATTDDSPSTAGINLCPQAAYEGIVARNPRTGMGFTDGLGSVVDVVWPMGYTAWDDTGVAVIRDASGTILAREGDRVLTGGGHTTDGRWYACSGLHAVEVDPIP